MPDEYISREAAIEEIDKWLDTVGTVLVGKGLSYYGELIGCIEDTPAADVAPVVHGWWKKVRKSRSTWECSVCGTKVGAFFAGCSQYCYCCGAQMGGVSE